MEFFADKNTSRYLLSQIKSAIIGGLLRQTERYLIPTAKLDDDLNRHIIIKLDNGSHLKPLEDKRKTP
jgi:hypothetical protein